MIEQQHTAADSVAIEHGRLVQIGKEIVRASSTLFVSLDLEADGQPGHGSMTAVGAVTPEGETFSREVRPAHAEFDPDTRAFNDAHGFEHERLLLEGRPVDEVMYDLDAWVADVASNRQPVLTAFNVSFDFGWVNFEMISAGIENRFGIAGYCLKSLAMSLQLIGDQMDYDWARTSKSRLPGIVRPPREFSHDPLDDAIWQQELHFAMVGLLHGGHR